MDDMNNPAADQPRLRADARRNRERILTAAVEVFIERGVDVPMDDVARRAGVGVGTLYRRFPDRARLVREVAVAMFEDADRIAATALREESSGWAAMVRLVLECAEPRIGALSASLRPWLSGHRATDHELTALAAQWTAQVETVVERAQDEGSMRQDVSALDLLTLVSLLTCHRPDLVANGGKAARRYLEILLDGLRRQEK